MNRYLATVRRVRIRTSVIFLLLAALLLSTLPRALSAAEQALARREGFLLLWRSINRPAEKVSGKPFMDVGPLDEGYAEIVYAKARGILDDSGERFRPSDPLKPQDALLWLFRTRSSEPLDEEGGKKMMELAESKDLATLAGKYRLSVNLEAKTMTSDELLVLMRDLDSKLLSEEHEVSFYAEKFHGDGTAFGEKFDMNALTAAHRSFPYNTLVRVTNSGNGKSVVVRINDRGPFVQGRDMDLSLAAFTQIADRAKGKIFARFERLGDVSRVRRCRDDRFQRRIIKGVILEPGIPHMFPLGGTLTLSSMVPFVIRDVVYPDGTNAGMQKWVVKGKTYEFVPGMEGMYRFLVGTKTGRVREMRMEVVSCGETN